MQTPRDRMLRRAERQQARYLRRPVAGSRLAGKIPVPDRARQADSVKKIDKCTALR